jgi:hypothetical protein
MADSDGPFWQTIDAPHGVVILSQSCDIIKEVERRPYVQVAGLVPANDGEIARAVKSDTPSRIYLEGLLDRGLLVDLDTTSTIHKMVVATWPRTAGCGTDAERRRVAAGLARHRHRFAFPDNFNEMVRPIRDWIESKRSKASPQGNFVRAMREVRVRCDNWEEPKELTFLAIVDHLPEPAELEKWREAAKLLEQKVANDIYPHGELHIVTYDEISARDYLESDRLDWEGLSDAA